MAARKRLRLLITGFGPFPGEPENPTGPLVRALARKFRDGPVQVSAHVFRTTYKAVDRDLPRLLKKHKPDALLMFGLAGTSRGLRIETKARNRIARFPDAALVIPKSPVIDAGASSSLPIRAPKQALLRAARSGALSARLSVNAGDYLCNYLYWHGLVAVKQGRTRRAAFVHVPAIVAGTRRNADNLLLCGEALATAMIRGLHERR